MNEKLMEHYKNIICLAESKILKAISYQFNVMVPTHQSFIEKVFKDLIDKKDKKRNEMYYLTKILILDSFRTEAPLIFKPLVITVACTLIAASFTGLKIP